MAEQAGQEKTLPATPRKRRKAREEGQVARSREVNSVLVLGGAVALFLLIGDAWIRSWTIALHEGLDLPALVGPGEDWSRFSLYWFSGYLRLLFPFIVVFPLLGLVATIPQVGLHLTPKVLIPDLKRLNPASGLKRIFSLQGLVETLKGFAKVLLIGWLAYGTLRAEMPSLPFLIDLPLHAALGHGALVAFKLVAKIWIALLFLAILDLMFQRWNFERELRMTKQEFKEEMKETDGDPQVKARIRSIQMTLARQRMMQEVPTADVVITNPEHVAVALRYDRFRDMAPVVVAKGAGWLSNRIREVAREHGIPVIERPPLARFLYRHVDLGREIPVEVYRVVAEVLSYVYRLRRQASDGLTGG